ncbi:hypothetical protein GCM10012275_26410 [Longimycelium tulufanense]|uniref:Uncharacterized protein n=1 Tax=Longimycelium tulufanense TaxID=907463 RepID=A0A8J3CCM6_9PSEU|nr:hypothetical protein [Longimycelium tulufanense]GGM53993.1 hypothetical protein GCM10012275_26410 [Longimycelium tulufanense]
MGTPEPSSLAELIADCAELPDGLRPTAPAVPEPRSAAPWRVDDRCAAQVADLEEYGS